MSQNLKKKNVKLTVFEVEKPLEMGLNLQKFRKKTCLFSQFFEREKSLDMGRGFRHQAARSSKT